MNNFFLIPGYILGPGVYQLKKNLKDVITSLTFSNMKHKSQTQRPQFLSDHDCKVSFDRTFVQKSRVVLIAMGLAFLYCIGYGLILFHEFDQMGILGWLVSKG